MTDPPTLKMSSWDQLQNRVSYPLVRPSWVIRLAPPAPVGDHNEDEDEDDFDSATEDERERRNKVLPPFSMRKEVMFPVFLRLSRNSLLSVMRVCRQWAEWAIDPSLWQSVSLAHSSINDLKLHGIVRRQPITLILDWCEISYDHFLWLLCRLPQLQNLRCEGLSWKVIHPLVSPYCPPLSELSLSFCEGVDDDTLSALLRSPPFNRPGYRDTTSRLRQLSRLRLAGTQVGDMGVSLIARSLPFLNHLDLSCCLRITNFALEFLAHSTSLVSHSLTSLDLRGCHQLTPLVLPLLAQLPILSLLALYPCDCIPQKAIKVWGMSNGYFFDDEYVMTRTPEIQNSIDDISDTEIEIASGKRRIQDIDNFQENSENCDILKKEGEKNTEKSYCESRLQFDKEFRCEKEKETPSLKSKEKKEYFEKQFDNLKGTKITESPQLKCVLTPLEKSCKTFERKFYHASSIENELNKSKESKASKCSKSCSDSESKSTSLCRRSERSNKGRKYKLSIAKRKGLNEKLKGNDGKFMKTENQILPQKKFEKPQKKSRQDQKYFSSNGKRKAKYILTRSKIQKMNEQIMKTKPEYEVVQKSAPKSLKNTKEGIGKGNISGEIEEGLKVRIALKSSPQYLSKLRKKQRDDDSSSASSFHDERQSTLTSENNKHVTKRRDDSPSSIKPKEQKEVSTKTDEFQKSEFCKNRKERRGSSSSSSSSCPSPAPCIPLSKKLKVELKPISKIGRRKSEVLKGTISGGANTEHNTGSSVLQGQSSSLVEKSSSRDRPERHHRSPRRLSMCQ